MHYYTEKIYSNEGIKIYQFIIILADKISTAWHSTTQHNTYTYWLPHHTHIRTATSTLLHLWWPPYISSESMTYKVILETTIRFHWYKTYMRNKQSINDSADWIYMLYNLSLYKNMHLESRLSFVNLAENNTGIVSMRISFGLFG